MRPLLLLIFISACASEAPAPKVILKEEARELLKNLVVAKADRLSVTLRKFGCHTEVSTTVGTGQYRIDPDLSDKSKTCDGHARGMVDTFTVALQALMAYENNHGQPIVLELPTTGETFASTLARALKGKWQGSLDKKRELLHSALLSGEGLDSYRPLFHALGYWPEAVDMEKLGPFRGLSREFKRELASQGFSGDNALLHPSHLSLSLRPLSNAP